MRGEQKRKRGRKKRRKKKNKCKRRQGMWIEERIIKNKKNKEEEIMEVES